MRNILGDKITLTLFGESHGPYVGATLDGMIPGIEIDHEFIKTQLAKRRPCGKSETARVELDEYEIISGVFNGYTTGAPITVIIPNKNINSSDYEKMKNTPRPSHADYVMNVKYDGFNDYRGGGHTSGRVTTPIVVIGAIMLQVLKRHNILVGTHILKCLDIEDVNFVDYENEIKLLQNKNYPLINSLEEELVSKLEKVAMEKDSVGGILQTAVINLPIGLGDPWFSSVEGKISNALFSIGAVKGIEFGEGFNFVNLTGKKANDEFTTNKDKIVTKTNHNGGINGGVTNGMPVVFNTVVKPTPSIGLPQTTVDLSTHSETTLTINGRHDPAIIRRIAVVIDSIVAIVVVDLLSMRYGDNFMNFED